MMRNAVLLEIAIGELAQSMGDNITADDLYNLLKATKQVGVEA